MGLTDAQRAIRRGRITASVAADILGEGRFGTSLTAWVAIMDLPREEIGDKPAVKAGNYFESGVADWWQDEVGTPSGLKLGPADTLVHPEHDWLAATPDRFVYDADGSRVAVLEIKTSALWNLDDWRDRDTRETTVPDYVRIQCELEMACAGLYRAHVAAVIGGNQPFFAVIESDPALRASLIAALGAWHKRHVLGSEQPIPTGRECDTRAFKYLHPNDTGEIVSLSDEAEAAAIESEKIAARIEHLAEQREQLRNVVRAELQTATFGESPRVRASYKTSRKGVRSLRLEIPQGADHAAAI
jgi:predicted phage-related endonuclease